MSEDLEITVQGTEALTRRLLEIGADAPKAATRAINKTLTTVRTLAARGLAAKLGVTQTSFAKSLWIWKAKFNDQRGTFRVGTRRLKLVNLRASQAASDVAFRYRKEYRDITMAAGAPFVQTMPMPEFEGYGSGYGHRGIFVRSTRPPEYRGGDPRQAHPRSKKQWSLRRSFPGSWLPIGEVYGPPLSRLFKRDLLQNALKTANDTLNKNLDHEINYILSQRVPAGDE